MIRAVGVCFEMQEGAEQKSRSPSLGHLENPRVTSTGPQKTRSLARRHGRFDEVTGLNRWVAALLATQIASVTLK
jgi:hypothetical protein